MNLFMERDLSNTGWGKIPSLHSVGFVKGGEAVEGWGWARKVQVVGKFPL